MSRSESDPPERSASCERPQTWLPVRLFLTDGLCVSVPPQDLGLEGNSLNDILYKNAAFLNLVDPISHELLLSLAREMQRPKKVTWLLLLLN